MKKDCKQCHSTFEVTDEDLAFYDKVSPTIDGKKCFIPPPTICPEDRMRRRMMFRNERNLYKRKCDLCYKDFLSIYRPDLPYTVYCHDCFFSDRWDMFVSGMEYDSSRSFFDQFRELSLKAPKLGILVSKDAENSEYNNHLSRAKNCYLMFGCTNCEDCYYGNYINNCKYVVDSNFVKGSELIYQGIDLMDCYNCLYCIQSTACSDSAFLFNCRNCSYCFLCTNLRNKKFCIRNKEYTKEEYEEMMRHIDISLSSNLKNFSDEFEVLQKQSIYPAFFGSNNENVSGNVLYNCKNCSEVFDLRDARDCKYCSYGTGVQDSYDLYSAYPTTELCYDTIAVGKGAYQCLFSYTPWESQYIWYSIVVMKSQYCFGCNNLSGAKYCIFNKQYTKEEYEALVQKIIERMIQDREWGEFFPPSLSHFAYNESLAYDYFPLTKEDAIAKDFAWYDIESSITSKDIKMVPENLKDASEEIISSTFSCTVCQKAFRITKPELEFHQKMHVAFPNMCPNCRHFHRLKQRLPRKLWNRVCANCSKEIKTSYSPERPEIVYCEDCYLKEVY